MLTVVLILGGYLLGSCPWGYWLVLLFRHEDIRKQGSGNIGGSNVWRTYGTSLGLAVILLDFAKGFVPAFLGTQLESELVGILAGGAAMVGHSRPLFLRFARGGKVIATGGGVLFALAPLAAATGLAIWIVVFLTTRIASVASIAVALFVPIGAWAFGYPTSVVAFAALAAAFAIFLHRQNIRRLLRGQEPRSNMALIQRLRGGST